VCEDCHIVKCTTNDRRTTRCLSGLGCRVFHKVTSFDNWLYNFALLIWFFSLLILFLVSWWPSWVNLFALIFKSILVTFFHENSKVLLLLEYIKYCAQIFLQVADDFVFLSSSFLNIRHRVFIFYALFPYAESQFRKQQWSHGLAALFKRCNLRYFLYISILYTEEQFG